MINKRRPGLVLTKAAQTTREVPVKVRSQRTSALRVARKAAPVTAAGKKRQQKKQQNNNNATLDVSSIQRHFREHPSKFDLPKGTNLRITIKYALLMLLYDLLGVGYKGTNTVVVFAYDVLFVAQLEQGQACGWREEVSVCLL